MHFIIVTENILLSFKLLSKGVIRQRERNGKQDKKKMNVEKEMNVDEQAVSGFVAVEKDRPGRDSFISQPKTQFSSSDQQ